MKEIKTKQESNALMTNPSKRWRRISNNIKNELACYVACVFEPTDMIEVRRLPSGKSTWYKAGNLVEAATSLVQDNQCGEHIYVGANPRLVKGGTKSKDVACANCLFVDFDRITASEAKYRWHNAGLPIPTITIASGHGIHVYWRLAKPMTDMDQWSALQKRLIVLINSDNAIHDPARLMRLPGFVNHKEPIALCKIIDEEHTRIYDLNFLTSLLYSVITESDYMAEYQAANDNTTKLKKTFYDNVNAVRIAKLTAARWLGVTKGGRNHKAFQNAAYLLKNMGLTDNQAWPILQHWNFKNKPPLPEWELRQTLKNAGIYGRHKAGKRIAG